MAIGLLIKMEDISRMSHIWVLHTINYLDGYPQTLYVLPYWFFLPNLVPYPTVPPSFFLVPLVFLQLVFGFIFLPLLLGFIFPLPLEFIFLQLLQLAFFQLTLLRLDR